MRQRIDAYVGVAAEAETGEQDTRPLVHRPPIDHREAEPPPEGQVTEHHVLRHRERGDQAQLLRDQREPGAERLARVAESASDTIHEDASGVGLVDAGEDLDQRGFAGAVLADDRVDFARCELERDLVESLSGEEALAEPLGDDHRHRATRGTIILGSTTRPRSMMTSPSSITVQSRIGTS